MKLSVKFPGAGMIHAITVDQSFTDRPLAYRDLKINSDEVIRLCRSMSIAAQENLVLLTPGGIGSHLYMNFARDSGIDEKIIRRVGCRHVEILLDILEAIIKTNFPAILVRKCAINNVAELAKDASPGILLLKPTPSILSTDSLCAEAARLAKADIVVLFKTQVPYFHAGFTQQTKIERWGYSDLLKRALNFESPATGNYIVDSQAIKILQQLGSRTFLMHPKDSDFVIAPESAERVTELFSD